MKSTDKLLKDIIKITLAGAGAICFIITLIRILILKEHITANEAWIAITATQPLLYYLIKYSS